MWGWEMIWGKGRVCVGRVQGNEEVSRMKAEAERAKEMAQKEIKKLREAEERIIEEKKGK